MELAHTVSEERQQIVQHDRLALFAGSAGIFLSTLDSGIERHKSLQDWWAACDAAGNLSEVLILHADLKAARTAAEESITLALKAAGLASLDQAESEFKQSIKS